LHASAQPNEKLDELTMTETVSEDRRKEVFRAIVETQDSGTSVKDSRAHIASRFNLTPRKVLEAERDGIAAKWPPL